MIKIFRKIRQNLLAEGKTTKYFKYAIGEIVLVVIGILIALQINNSNIQRLDKIEENKYLKNIKIDLEKDIVNLNYNLEFRRKKVLGTKQLIEIIKGGSVENLTTLTYNIVNTLYQERFQPSNVTYRDLVSSGNMNLISNDSIKLLLFELDLLYQRNSFSIEHETNEYEENISKPIFNYVDVERMKPVFLGLKTAEEANIKLEDYTTLFQSKSYKNGCVLSNWTTEEVIDIYLEIENKSKKIIKIINQEFEL